MSHDELEGFDRDYEAWTGRSNDISVLADGAYDFAIVAAELTRTQKTQELILRWNLVVLSPGQYQDIELEHTYFFRTAESVNLLGGDLVCLGFDADQWTAEYGRRFSAELPLVVPRLAGIRFRAEKLTVPGKTRKDGGEIANLQIRSRISAGPNGRGPGPGHGQGVRTPSPAPRPATSADQTPPRRGQAPPPRHTTRHASDEIPF